MSETASISSGIAARYGTAVFELAKEAKILPTVEQDAAALVAALNDSADFTDLITSPIYSSDEQSGAIRAIAAKMDLSDIMANTLGLMARKRRLFVLPFLLKAIQALIAQDRGEVTAEVTSAKTLTAAQTKKLATALKKSIGKDVKIKSTVDNTIIGGLIVKVGSRMIDSSIASKLSNLQNAMKEVG